MAEDGTSGPHYTLSSNREDSLIRFAQAPGLVYLENQIFLCRHVVDPLWLLALPVFFKVGGLMASMKQHGGRLVISLALAIPPCPIN
jgi:hypothetical protein